jgi:ABC-type phosphate/phosphonate transport system substrate-binding protein
MLLASLPMYDWPEIRAATDAFWAGLCRHAGVDVALDRTRDHHDLWRQSSFQFSQTCGYPFTHEFKGLLQYIATPHYAADGCDGAQYSSIVFAREDVPLAAIKGWRPAVNSLDSMSGHLALKLAFPTETRMGDFFAPALITGGHLSSLAAVREGRADLCAIDAVCVELARKYRPQDLDGVVEIARSPMVPGLPFVTRGGDVKAWRAAVLKTFADPSLAKARAALLLGGISVLAEGAYEKILALEEGA